MNVGKTLFAQVMEFVPWKSFGRIINRHTGDARVCTLGCADLFRVMAFSQLTWRKFLRDIEVCLTASRAKLFHMDQLSGELPSNGGKVLFSDIDVTALPIHRRVQLGLLRSYQITSIFEEFTVQENAVLSAMGAYGRGQALRTAGVRPYILHSCFQHTLPFGLPSHS